MVTQTQVKIPPMGLEGDLIVPPGATGLVVFAHGSGSRRPSARNRYVAGEPQRGGLGTLLFGLLTPAEEEADAEPAQLPFHVRPLTTRVLAARESVMPAGELGRL